MDQLARRFKNRNSMPNEIFQLDQPSESRKEKFAKFEKLWSEEGLPEAIHFEKLFDIVKEDSPDFVLKAHNWIREYVLLPGDAEEVDFLVETGIVEHRPDVGALVRRILERSNAP